MCRWVSISPGATMPPTMIVSVASLRLPGGCTLAISGPTRPISAARNSPVAMSATVPPASSRSNGALPVAARTARSRRAASLRSASFMTGLLR